MIIDAHTHLLTPDLQVYSYPQTEWSEEWEAEKLVRIMDEVGLDAAVVFTGFALSLSGYSIANDSIAKAARRFQSRLIGFGTVHPREEDAVSEAERCFGELGLRGLKFHPWLQSFAANDRGLQPILEVAGRHRAPVMFHTGTPPYTQPLQVAEHADRFPDVNLIMGHFGKLLWWDAVRAAMKHDNVYLETSGAQVADLEVALENLGAERLLFGSDLPIGGADSFHWCLSKIRVLSISDEEKGLILGRNLETMLSRFRI